MTLNTAHTYAGDDPVNGSDPLGLSAVGYCAPTDCPTEHGGNVVINLAGSNNPVNNQTPCAGTLGYSATVIGEVQSSPNGAAMQHLQRYIASLPPLQTVPEGVTQVPSQIEANSTRNAEIAKATQIVQSGNDFCVAYGAAGGAGAADIGGVLIYGGLSIAPESGPGGLAVAGVGVAFVGLSTVLFGSAIGYGPFKCSS